MRSCCRRAASPTATRASTRRCRSSSREEPSVAAEAPERSPLRLAGRIAAALVGVAFVALLAYGLVTKSPDRTVDDGLRKSGSVAAPALNQPALERGVLGGTLPSRVRNVLSGP